MRLHSAAVAPNSHSVRFSGIHEDALIGADTRLSGVVSQTESIEKTFEALKASGKLSRHVSGGYRPEKPIELSLTREPDSTFDPNSVRLELDGAAMGYLPKPLAAEVAPLMDKSTRFTAYLNEIKPYWDWRAKKQRYSVDTRVEWLTQPGRAPSQRLWPTVLAGFERARLGDPDKIQTVIPERLDTFEAGGKTGTQRLVQRYDQERGEKSYYLAGHLVARGKNDPLKDTSPDFLSDKLSADVQTAITKQLNTVI